MSKPDGPPAQTFEEALGQLESIVNAIEQGKIGLQESIAQYEKGMRLIQYCRSVLSDAEGKIQQLQLGEGGRLQATPFETPNSET
jgi:exodeoxyribonuclease VII small subunit